MLKYFIVVTVLETKEGKSESGIFDVAGRSELNGRHKYNRRSKEASLLPKEVQSLFLINILFSMRFFINVKNFWGA